MMKIREGDVKWVSIRSFALAGAACVVTLMAGTLAGAEDEASPIFGVRIPEGYRDWKVISVAHEAGNNNDIRVILGNDIALGAFRVGTRPFPDGTIIARLAWQYVPSARNDAIFGQPQSFVAGAATNVQFSVKDSRRYADTNGWGYGQFEDGHPNHSESLMRTCLPCHARLPQGEDFVFTHYSP